MAVVGAPLGRCEVDLAVLRDDGDFSLGRSHGVIECLARLIGFEALLKRHQFFQRLKAGAALDRCLKHQHWRHRLSGIDMGGRKPLDIAGIGRDCGIGHGGLRSSG